MNLLPILILSIILGGVTVLSYRAIKDINDSTKLTPKNKNILVFSVLLFPIFGALSYFLTKKYYNS